MQSASMSLAVMIHGPNGAHEAREYVSPVDHATYVEGREGSNFTLTIRNGSPRKVLAVPALDGLSVLDGKPAGASSPGYVLAPYQTLDLGGWIVDGETAAKFFFAGCSSEGNDSYVAQVGGDTANNGVIGVIFFAENRPAPVLRNHDGAMFASAASASKGMLRSAQLSASAAMPEVASQSLGAGFGEAMEFRTRTVDFRRGERLTDLVIHYDDARGLKRRGIDVSRPAAARPTAFPRMPWLRDAARLEALTDRRRERSRRPPCFGLENLVGDHGGARRRDQRGDAAVAGGGDGLCDARALSMHVGSVLTYGFVLVWAAFVVRGIVTGRMLARGGDIVRAERPTAFAFAMAGNVVVLVVVVLILMAFPVV